MNDPENRIDDEPVAQPDPEAQDVTRYSTGEVLMRGLSMLILIVLFGIAETILLAAAILQFGWMLFVRKPNLHLAWFGDSLGRWMAQAASFQTAATEEKPFPWSSWES